MNYIQVHNSHSIIVIVLHLVQFFSFVFFLEHLKDVILQIRRLILVSQDEFRLNAHVD